MTDTPQQLPAVLTSAEVAARFRRSTDWFRHNRARLQAHGFPAPLPGLKRLWSAAAVERWLAGGTSAEDEQAARATRLEARALELAQRLGVRR